MQRIPKNRISQYPRSILDKQIWPFRITDEISPSERVVEKLIHDAEVEATRPSWQRALAAALGDAS